jgi:hypothetical protein
LRKRNDKEA